MRFTVKLFLTWVFIFLTFYVGVLLVMGLLWEVFIDFWKIVLAFLIVGVIPPAVITAFFAKKLNYPESEDLKAPKFENQKRATLTFRQLSMKQKPFEEMMMRVDRQWVVSFTDRKNQVLKFRTDTQMMSWGVGVYMKMEDAETVQVIVYPIYPISRREKMQMNRTLRILQSILNP